MKHNRQAVREELLAAIEFIRSPIRKARKPKRTAKAKPTQARRPRRVAKKK